MKLYATVTSERASKGQGGNEYIIVNFTVNHELVGQVELYLYDDDERHEADDNEWLLKFRRYEDEDFNILVQGHTPSGKEMKGKKQKGECANNHYPRTLQSGKEFCNSCGEEQHE